MILSYIHGPFNREGGGRTPDNERAAIKAAANAGTCKCRVCTRTGKCEPVPQHHCWLQGNRPDGQGLYLAKRVGSWQKK